MRRLAPLAVLAVLAIPAIWPFLLPDIARTNDNLPHYFRLVELDRLLRQGVLYPRWGSDLVHGYGYPVFNFFPSLFHYSAEFFHLAGLNFLNAYKAAAIAALLLSAWAAFWLGREWFGPLAGIVAGVAYVYSPYLLYDAHVRGAPPESLALALFPLVLLGIWRVSQGSVPAVFWTGLAFAAFVLSHQGVALQASPFVLGAGLLGAFLHARGRAGQAKEKVQGREALKSIGLVVAALIFGMTLSAFFWLPALAESQSAQIERGTGNAGMSYQLNFLSLTEMLALPRLPVDPALLNPPVTRTLPHIGLLFALLAPLGWRRADHPRRWLGLALIVSVLLAAGLISPLARPLWDSVSLLRMTLFPWRLLGPASLLVSLLAGATVSFAFHQARARLRPGWRWAPALVPAIALSGLMIGGLPWAYPPFEPINPSPTLADLARFEIPPHFIGTTTVGEYLPVWVQQLPNTRPMFSEIITGHDPDRVDPASLPDGASLELAARSPLGAAYTIQTPVDFRIVYRTFFFPGWQAELNGQPAQIQITEPEGLIAVDVPRGSHSLRFYFGTTLPRVAGGLTSAIALIAGGAILWVEARRRIRKTESTRKPSAGEADGIVSPAHSLALAVFGIVFLGIKLTLIDPGRTPLLRTALNGDSLAGVLHPLQQDFRGELMLLGWDASKENIRADETVELRLYWKAQRLLGIPYGIKVELRDRAGKIWSQADPPRPRNWRFTPGTDFWPVDQYVLDPYLLTPVEGAPPGDYSVDVTVFGYHDLQSLGTASIGSLAITRPSHSEPAGGLARFGRLELLEGSLDRSEAAPGDTLSAQLLWGLTQRTDGNASGVIEVMDSSGATRASNAFTLGNSYPTSLWEPGDRLRDQLSLTLPAGLETGGYSVSVRASELGVSGAAPPFAIGTLRVTAPQRTFAAPPVSLAMAAELSPAIELYGASFAPTARAGETLAVSLEWLARQELPLSYRVFVHLQDTAGSLVAQSDGVPAGWTRPTTGWLSGEYIRDEHAVSLPADLPPGKYALFTGLYDPATGARLSTPEFPDGRVALGPVRLTR